MLHHQDTPMIPIAISLHTLAVHPQPNQANPRQCLRSLKAPLQQVQVQPWQQQDQQLQVLAVPHPLTMSTVSN